MSAEKPDVVGRIVEIMGNKNHWVEMCTDNFYAGYEYMPTHSN